MTDRYRIVFSLLCITTFPLLGNIDPEAYNASNSGQFKHAIKELHKLHLSGSEHILDIGSGDGKVSCYIAKEYIPKGQLTGIDKNADMVSFARSHAATSNTIFTCADAIEYKDVNRFDAIVSFWTLHWVSDYTKALQNIADSLKPGGKALVCHIVGVDPLEPIVNTLLNKEQWKSYQRGHVTLIPSPSVVQVANAIEKSGLRIDSLEVKKNEEWMPVETVKKNLLSLPLFDFIPAELRGSFCDQVLQEFILEYPLNEHGKMRNWVPVVAIVLEKRL